MNRPDGEPKKAISVLAGPFDPGRHPTRDRRRLVKPIRPSVKPIPATPVMPKPGKTAGIPTAAPGEGATSAPAVPDRPNDVRAPTGVPPAGAPSGMALKALKGTVITTAGTVIDGADINGSVTVAASNVVIKRSRISGSGDYGVYVRSGSLTIEDSTITGFDNSMTGDNYTASGIEVTGSSDDGFKIGSNVSIRNSWCHDLATAPGAHSDCGQIQSGITDVVITGNWFDPGSSNANAALFIAPDLGPSSPGPLLVAGNVLGGGNYSLFCVDGNNGRYFISGITLQNNRFLRNSNYGPMRINVQALVTGNIWNDTKAAISN